MSHQINAACLSRQTPYWYPDRKLPPVTSSIAIWFPTSSFRVLFAVDATRSTLHLGPHPHVAPGKCQKTIISLEAKWYLGSQLTHFQPALLLLVAFSLDSAPTFFRSFLRAKRIWFTCSRASLGLGIKVLFC